MKITKVHLNNVKNFKNQIDVELSDYNVFIGKNGSGKSNLAKAISQVVETATNQPLGRPVPFQGNYSESSSIEVEVHLDNDDLKEFVSTKQFIDLSKQSYVANSVPISAFYKDSMNFKRGVTADGLPLFEILEFPRSTGPVPNLQNAYASVYYSLTFELRKKTLFIPDTRDLPGSFSYQGNFQNEPIALNNFMTFFTSLKLDRRQRPLYDKIVGFYKRIIPSIEDLIINPVGNNVSLGEEGSNFNVPALEISKGTREILVLLAMLVMAKRGSILFIEEPEIHLHPGAIRVLKDIIRELIDSKNLQIIITTHSGEFLVEVVPESPESKVIRFVRESDGSTSIYPVKNLKELSEAMEELERKR